MGKVGPFHRYDMLTADITQRQQATGHRPVMHFIVVEFTHKYRTGSAIALTATDLCARQMTVIADKIQEDFLRRQVSCDQLFIENKLYQVIFILLLKLKQNNSILR
jgi:hypothetical protein